MSEWIDICALTDLQPNSGVCALVDNQQVAIIYTPQNNTAYAISNFDPYGKAHVISRGLLSDINGEPMICSPLYKQHFSLLTGICHEDKSIKLDIYTIRINNDRVEINLEK